MRTLVTVRGDVNHWFPVVVFAWCSYSVITQVIA